MAFVQGDASASGDIAIHITADGEKYIDLGKKKRATVRSFKGTALVDIREFYGADGAEKPGKKGISLTQEQVRYITVLFTTGAADLNISEVGDIENRLTPH